MNETDNSMALPTARATRASTEPASSLGHSAGIANAVEFNLNGYMRFKPTETGWDILRADQERMREAAPSYDWKLPEVDVDGFIRWQAWQVFQMFGPHISMGMRVPFETTVLMELDAKAMETRSAMTAGHGPQDDSAVPAGDLPETPQENEHAE